MKNIEIDCLGHPRHHIPDDLIFDVLKWLPAKSLMRFKTVCKSWFALITDPDFAESHYTISKTLRSDSSHLLCYVATDNLMIFPARRWLLFPVKPRWGIFPARFDGVLSNQLPVHSFDAVDGYDDHLLNTRNIVNGSSIVNGLICIWVKQFQFELLNLTTREKVSLPIPETRLSHIDRNNPMYYLGFDPIKEQYKVLFRGENGEYFIITFSNNMCMSWRKVATKPELCLYGGENTCVDGAIYWHTYSRARGPYSYEVRREEKVQYFEVGEEKFKVLQVHDQVGKDQVYLVFQTEIGGKFTLAFLHRFYRHDTDQITLWRLVDRHDEVWVESRIEVASSLLAGRHLTIHGSTNAGNMLLKTSSPWSSDALESCDSLIFCDLGKEKRHETVRLMGYTDKLGHCIPTPMSHYVALRYHVENILPLNNGKRKAEEPRDQRNKFHTTLFGFLGSKVSSWLSTTS